MCFFDRGDGGFGGIGLTVVVRNGADVTSHGGLGEGVGAGLAAYRRDHGESVFGADGVVDAIGGGPIGGGGGIWGYIVVL